MKIKKFLRKPLAVAACLTFATAATAQTFSNTIFFGDSDTDSGRFKYTTFTTTGSTSATYGGYTVNPGLMWSQIFGKDFGVTVTPSDAPGGGNNYAAGGARISYTQPNSNTWSATSQVAAYLNSTVGQADPHALYTIWIGPNDLQPTTVGGLGNIVEPANVAALQSLAQQTTGLIVQLYNAGARYFLVPNTPGFASAESSTASGYAWDPIKQTSRSYYDQQVWNSLASQGINFVPADIKTVWNYIVLNPAQFGLTNVNVNTPACGSIAAYNCNNANLVSPNANQTYLFADNATYGGHFTQVGQQIEADYFYNLLTAPGQVSLLATTASVGQASANSVYLDQIGYSFRGTAPKTLGAWATGGYQSITVNNVGSTNPVGGAAGMDYQLTENLLLGGYIGAGQATFNYNANSGNFTQNTNTVGAYSAWRTGGAWANGLASYNYLTNTVNRNTPIGIATFNNSSSVNGSIASVALRTGYDFDWHQVTHGPVVGLAYQSTNINGFAESGNFTSLAFGKQTVNATIASVGYQASAKVNNWIPFARVMYNNQSGADNRQITTSLTTVQAPSYTMPAVSVGNNWTDLTAGIGYQVGKDTVVRVSFTEQVGQTNVNSYNTMLSLVSHF